MQKFFKAEKISKESLLKMKKKIRRMWNAEKP